MDDHKPAPEAEAKAAVLGYIRDKARLGETSAIISELELRSAGRRTDLVVTSPEFIGIEIKTSNDTLGRLAEQTAINSLVFPRSYAALASRHLSRGIDLVPPACGILELRNVNDQIVVLEVRKAKLVRKLDPKTQLSITPTAALKQLLKSSGATNTSKLKRSELLCAAELLDGQKILEFVTTYLEDKYRITSNKFRSAICDRKVTANDLKHLRAWLVREQPINIDDDLIFFRSLAQRFGREAFGPIPDDIASDLAPEGDRVAA